MNGPSKSWKKYCPTYPDENGDNGRAHSKHDLAAYFAGTSTGANVVAALRVAARLGPAATVATLIVDSGAKYLSTDLFREG